MFVRDSIVVFQMFVYIVHISLDKLLWYYAMFYYHFFLVSFENTYHSGQDAQDWKVLMSSLQCIVYHVYCHYRFLYFSVGLLIQVKLVL